MERVKEDELLWHILAIIGINLSNYRLKTYENVLSILVILIIFMLSLHWISASVCFMFTKKFINGFAYFLLPVQSILICLCLSTKKKSVSYIVQKLYVFRKRYIKKYRRLFLINAVIITMISLPIMISIFVYSLF